MGDQAPAPNKISFGFSKMKKKSAIIPGTKPVEKKPEVEYITSFEEREVTAEEKPPLTIAVKNVDGIRERIMAARKNKETETEIKPIGYDNPYGSRSVNVIPLKQMEDDEAKKKSESVDYDSVPVEEFGLAMLRGMGWAPGKGIGKQEKLVEFKEPELRPRGLGLGAGPDAIMKNESKKDREKS